MFFRYSMQSRLDLNKAEVYCAVSGRKKVEQKPRRPAHAAQLGSPTVCRGSNGHKARHICIYAVGGSS